MAYSDIRNAMADVLRGVSDIGEVHEHARHTVQWEPFFRRHVSDGRVNTWEITRVGSAQESVSVQNSAGTLPFFHDTHTILIRGAVGLQESALEDEASEAFFQDLVDNVIAAFRVNQLLDNNVILPASLQGETIGHAMYGSVFAHVCELEYQATERVGG